MNKQHLLKSIALLTIAFAAILLTACSASTATLQETSIPETSEPITVTDTDEPVFVTAEPALPTPTLIPSTENELTSSEIEGLLFMREEEKLARDVYQYLYQIWGVQVFSNIAQSEEAHTQSVLTLIERYGLSDPASTTGEGEFVNPDLQALYDQLVAEGSQSLRDAFLVGAAIEEIDILDLQSRIESTQRADIIQVYENLLKGSSNHLQAFVRSISNQVGETYQPQYLTQEVFDEFVGSFPGNGQGGIRGNGRNHGS